jgi:hypothetical protein
MPSLIPICHLICDSRSCQTAQSGWGRDRRDLTNTVQYLSDRTYVLTPVPGSLMVTDKDGCSLGLLSCITVLVPHGQDTVNCPARLPTMQFRLSKGRTRCTIPGIIFWSRSFNFLHQHLREGNVIPRPNPSRTVVVSYVQSTVKSSKWL